ncbi:hypothetical protein OA40_16030 [Morganella morganii]|nr:hypothetical protein OA40_16030 [Morganella morganii]BEP20496.1 hypothetical protein SUGSMm_12930 [Morganella morganii subsp. sibonii]HAE77249.1 hypothetical protein [Morganella sp. (in: enterobacteria)]HAS8352344.1 hypothetical protein [Vibrio vulnificus]KNZ84963.1 hypothetical protein AKG16_17675 [Morganella morganii]
MLRPLVQRFSLICREANHVFHPVTLATPAVYPPSGVAVTYSVTEGCSYDTQGETGTPDQKKRIGIRAEN